jgi:hypothetical protein
MTKVNSTQNQIIRLSSKHLFCLPKSWLHHLIDFNAIINEKSFGTNYSPSSCICEKFHKLKYQEQELSLSISIENLNCLVSFFELMEGYSFCFEDIDFSNLAI